MLEREDHQQTLTWREGQAISEPKVGGSGCLCRAEAFWQADSGAGHRMEQAFQPAQGMVDERGAQ